ncbi:MAG: flagellar protein FlaG [Solibacillus sp.]
MRITSQNADLSIKQTATQPTQPTVSTTSSVDLPKEKSSEQPVDTSKQSIQQSDMATMKEKLEPAIETINEVLETTNKSSKFVLHEGLDKYFVRLVDADTDEVIKEIPPERLLNAFYELQKLAGMIVDEKI